MLLFQSSDFLLSFILKSVLYCFQYGFNMVIQHREAINCISLSLIHKSLRTKALVLELLAAICLVKGGHEIILSAFDNFKEVCHEAHRFQTLMDYFLNYEVFHIEFMVSRIMFNNQSHTCIYFV